MRPRVFPAEDSYAPSVTSARLPASMRPRVFPAEDAMRVLPIRRGLRSFNEAAGIPRGRLTRGIELLLRYGVLQ